MHFLTDALVHSLETSLLDYGNVLLFNISNKYVLSKFQWIRTLLFDLLPEPEQQDDTKCCKR